MEMKSNYTDAYVANAVAEPNKYLALYKIKKRVKYLLKILNYILLIVIGLFFVYPFLWMASMSLRPLVDALSFEPGLLVPDPRWENYIYAWKQAQISHYVGNSVKYSVLVLTLQYITIIPSAFAFATMEFKGKKLLWAVKYLGMMLPSEATLIPVYFFYSKLGLVDTWGGLILPSLFNMFGIYMFMNAIKQIPKEVIESARMDKAKNLGIMVKIIIPMILPVIITHLLVTFISNWNEYFWVLMMTNSEKIRTLPVALRGLIQSDDSVPEWNVVMAGTMIQIAPIMLIYIFASKQVKNAIVRGHNK